MSSLFHMVTEAGKLDRNVSTLTRGSAEHSWFALLCEAATYYPASTGLERQHSNKLISLGRRQAEIFLGTISGRPLFVDA